MVAKPDSALKQADDEIKFRMSLALPSDIETLRAILVGLTQHQIEHDRSPTRSSSGHCRGVGRERLNGNPHRSQKTKFRPFGRDFLADAARATVLYRKPVARRSIGAASVDNHNGARVRTIVTIIVKFIVVGACKGRTGDSLYRRVVGEQIVVVQPNAGTGNRRIGAKIVVDQHGIGDIQNSAVGRGESPVGIGE